MSRHDAGIPDQCLMVVSVYANGEVCISILHSPGDDPLQYESAAERWSPVQSVEKYATLPSPF